MPKLCTATPSGVHDWTPLGVDQESCDKCGTFRRRTGHVHKWRATTTSGALTKRECAECGEAQVSMDPAFGTPRCPKSPSGDHTWFSGTSKRTCLHCSLVEEIDRKEERFMETVGSYGGITAYDVRTQMVKFGDGSTMTLEALALANGITPGELELMLSKALQLNRAAAAPTWTSDDALTLILEEIKHADDPFKTGGEWMTRITNAISEAIRED